MIQEFDKSNFRVFGLLEEWDLQEGYWAVPKYSLEIKLLKPDDNGQQVVYKKQKKTKTNLKIKLND